MRLNRFYTQNEAKNVENKQEAIDFIKKELKAKKMSQREVRSSLDKKFKDDKLTDIVYAEIFRKTEISSKLNKEYYVVDGKKHHSYFWLGDDASEPTGDVVSYNKKKDKDDKPEKKDKKKIKKYEDFDEKDAKKAEKDAKDDIKKDKKGDKSDRQVDFSKDSTKELIAKLRNDKYKKQWDDIEEILNDRTLKNKGDK